MWNAINLYEIVVQCTKYVHSDIKSKTSKIAICSWWYYRGYLQQPRFSTTIYCSSMKRITETEYELVYLFNKHFEMTVRK